MSKQLKSEKKEYGVNKILSRELVLSLLAAFQKPPRHSRTRQLRRNGGFCAATVLLFCKIGDEHEFEEGIRNHIYSR